MSWELLYTSAPRGLKPGSQGFCTVVGTQGLAANLADRLESLSGYRHVFTSQDARADLNPIAYSHLQLAVTGRTYYVLSRVADAGLDYTRRTNKLAHHVVLEPAELPAAGPAWVLAPEQGFLRTSWDGRPALMPSGPKIGPGDLAPGVCRLWRETTGDAGWAGVLAETLFAPARSAVILFRPGTPILGLLAESLAIVPPALRWTATFCTYYTKLPAGVDCRWRCVLDGSPEAAALRNAPRALVLDLRAPLGEAPAGIYADAARRGVMLSAPSIEAAGRSVPATFRSAAELRQESRSTSDDALEIYGCEAMPSSPVPVPVPPPVCPVPPVRREFRRKPKSHFVQWAIAGVVLAAVGLVATGWILGRQWSERGDAFATAAEPGSSVAAGVPDGPDVKLVDVPPAEAKSGEAKSGEAKSGEAKSGEAKSGEVPRGEKKAGDGGKSAEEAKTAKVEPPKKKTPLEEAMDELPEWIDLGGTPDRRSLPDQRSLPEKSLGNSPWPSSSVPRLAWYAAVDFRARHRYAVLRTVKPGEKWQLRVESPATLADMIPTCPVLEIAKDSRGVLVYHRERLPLGPEVSREPAMAGYGVLRFTALDHDGAIRTKDVSLAPPVKLPWLTLPKACDKPNNVEIPTGGGRVWKAMFDDVRLCESGDPEWRFEWRPEEKKKWNPEGKKEVSDVLWTEEAWRATVHRRASPRIAAVFHVRLVQEKAAPSLSGDALTERWRLVASCRFLGLVMSPPPPGGEKGKEKDAESVRKEMWRKTLGNFACGIVESPDLPPDSPPCFTLTDEYIKAKRAALKLRIEELEKAASQKKDAAAKAKPPAVELRSELQCLKDMEAAYEFAGKFFPEDLAIRYQVYWEAPAVEGSVVRLEGGKEGKPAATLRRRLASGEAPPPKHAALQGR